MTWGAALLASLLITLDRPRWWLLALAAFLLRGGLLLFLIPIVILPTPAGLANVLAPTLVGFVFGSPSASFIALVVLTTTATAGWLLIGGVVAAWIEVTLIGEAAAKHLPAAGVGRTALAWRALVVRLLSALPLVVVMGWGVVRVIDAAYAEVIRPSDLSTSITLRVVERVPEVVVLLITSWLAGETAGGLAVRHLVIEGRVSTARALVQGWLGFVARPSGLATLLVTSAGVLAVAVPAAAAAGFAWSGVRNVLAEPVPPVVEAAALGSFVAVWLAGLALVAVAVAWRSSAWTFEVVRRRVARPAVRHAPEPVGV